MDSSRKTRRAFITGTTLHAAGLLAAGSAAAAPRRKGSMKPATRRKIGPNDRIRCGFVGVGNRGSSILQSTLALDGVDVVAVADTYDVWRDRAGSAPYWSVST